MGMTILITGATGRTASHLTKRLLESGSRVRALVRSHERAKTTFGDLPAVAAARLEVVAGDFADGQLLDRAFDGIDRVFLALGTSPQQIALEKALIDAAARARVRQAVRLSVLGSDPAAGWEVARRHGELDAHLAATGVPHTVLRPAWFASNLLGSARPIASSDRFFGLVPTGRIAIIDARDLADAAHAVLADASLHDARYDLTGPEALTLAGVAARFSAVLGRPIAYVPVDEGTLRLGLAKSGIAAWLVDIIVGIERAMEAGDHATVTPDLERLLGRPARTLDDFLRDHQAAFVARAA
jgi:uncharacterized protein YbjT (DUF2867 family)